MLPTSITGLASRREFRHCSRASGQGRSKRHNDETRLLHYRKVGAALMNLTNADLGDDSILLGGPQKIVDTLKGVQALGIEEVILYFNYGRKPDAMVREQMDRFMKDVAPAFAG